MPLIHRIAIVAAVIAGIALLGFVMADSPAAGAIRQWFQWIGRAASDLVWRLFGPILEPISSWLSRMARQSAFRQVTKGTWRVMAGIMIGLIIRYGVMSKRSLYTKLHTIEMTRFRLVRAVIDPLRKAWNYRPDLPRWVRALIALAAIATAIWLCFKVSLSFGQSWSGWFGSLAFSILVFWVVEKLPLVGFDALLSFLGEKWQRFREWRKRWPRLNAVLSVLSGEYFVRIIIHKLTAGRT